MNDTKEWFYNFGKERLGPFSLEELGELIRQEGSAGRLTPDTYVWKQGMAEWAHARTIREINQFFGASKPPVAAHATLNTASRVNSRTTSSQDSELSAMIEMRPGDVDDRTSALDLGSLRQAEKEAKKVLRQIEKGSKENIFYRRSFMSRHKTLLMFLSLAIVAGGVEAVREGWLEQSAAAFRGKQWVSQLFVTIPKIEDMSPKDYSDINYAAQSPLNQDGPRIKLALSMASIERPTFYVGTNLPDGTSFEFVLLGEAGDILSQKNVYIRLPVKIMKKMGKTPLLHLKDNLQIPPGLYQTFLFEDEEQTDEVKALLAKLPVQPEFPYFLPKGRKLFVTEKYFLGGPEDESFKGAVSQLRSNMHKEAEAELRQLQAGIQLVDSLYQITSNECDGYFKDSNKTSAIGKWNDFNQKWQPNNAIFNEKGQYYSHYFNSLLQLQGQIKAFHEFQNSQISALKSGQDAPSAQKLIVEKSEAVGRSLASLKAELEATAKNLTDPDFLPRLRVN